MFLFIHIPKTAGTSLREVLEQRVGGRVAYDYGLHSELTHPLLRDTTLSRAEQRAMLEDLGFEVLYGHFLYHDWREAFQPSEVVAVLRDPVDRCVSHYQHYLTRGGEPGDRMAPLVSSGRLSLQDFANMPMQRNLQARFLGIEIRHALDLRHYGAALTSEGLGEMLGLTRRVNTGRRSFDVTPEAIVEIIKLNTLDVKLHALARQAWREGFWGWEIPHFLRPPSGRRWFARRTQRMV